MHWLHAQTWAATNAARLCGTGDVEVRFDGDNDLSDRVRFEAFLTRAFESLRPGAEVTRSLQEEAHHLQKLDPRLSFRICADQESKHYEILAAREDVPVGFTLRLVASSESREAFMRAVTYGDVTKVDVDELTITGSPALERLRPHGGRASLTLFPQPFGEGVLRFRSSSDDKRVIFKTHVQRRAGLSGASLSNFSTDSLLKIELRFAAKGRVVEGGFSVALDEESLLANQLRDVCALGPLGEWAADVIATGSVSLEAEFEEGAAPIVLTPKEFDALKPLLWWIRYLSAVQDVSMRTGSKIKLSAASTATPQDWADVTLMQKLLRGEEVPRSTGPLEVMSDISDQCVGTNNLVLTQRLTLTLMGQWLAEIPVRIGLIGYQVERVGPQQCRLFPGPEARALMKKLDPSDPLALGI
jgi:hypothetical protein